MKILAKIRDLYDYYIRYIKYSEHIARFFAKTRITPNQISIGSFILLSIPAAVLFSFGIYNLNLIAILLLYLYRIADNIDGKVARIRGETSELGKFLDGNLDWLHAMLILSAICIGNVSVFVAVLFFVVLGIDKHLVDMLIARFSFITNKEHRKEWDKIETKGWQTLVKNANCPTGLWWIPFMFRYILIVGLLSNRIELMILTLTGTFAIKAITSCYLLIANVAGSQSFIVKEMKKYGRNCDLDITG